MILIDCWTSTHQMAFQAGKMWMAYHLLKEYAWKKQPNNAPADI